MRTKELVASAQRHVRARAGMKAVYGDPVIADGKTVIPVAKVTTEPPATEGAEPAVRVKPLGVVELGGPGEDQQARFIPVHQKRQLSVAALIGSAVGFLAGIVMGRRRASRA